MNRFFLSWCVTGALWLLACAGEDQSDAEASIELGERTIPADVREELISLGLQDQEMRQDLSSEKMQDTLFLKALLQGDSARTERVRGIVYRYGWPDSTRAGPGAARAAFLVLQHSPVHEWQKQMLPTIEDLARRGGLPRQDAEHGRVHRDDGGLLPGTGGHKPMRLSGA